MKSLAHITIESKDAKQMTWHKLKRAVTQIPLKTLKLLDKQSMLFPGVFPIGMI